MKHPEVQAAGSSKRYCSLAPDWFQVRSKIMSCTFTLRASARETGSRKICVLLSYNSSLKDLSNANCSVEILLAQGKDIPSPTTSLLSCFNSWTPELENEEHISEIFPVTAKLGSSRFFVFDWGPH